MRSMRVLGAMVIAAASGMASAGDEEKVEGLSLLPGDDAPGLAVTHWVKGEELDGFEEGQVYVVDFWATWCGPCIASMPHLTEVQAKHAESVTVVAVNIWEGVEDLGERVEKVAAKVRELGEKMDVRVAVDGKERMEKTWMEAAGRNGIPSTFIVDQGGRIAWIGHPMGMDEPLEAVLAGRFDLDESRKAYAKSMKEEMARRAKFEEMQEAMKAGDGAAFAEAARRHYGALLEDNPGMLNMVAWEMTTNEAFEERDLELAYKAAKRACELTEWKDAYILDTYAHVLFARGDAERAVEYEKKAIKAAGEDASPELLESMKAALKRFKGAGAASAH